MKSDGRDDRPPGDGEVGRAYRAARFRDEPPPHVDASILAAARRREKRGLRQWLGPVAMAATVLLALGIVLRLTVPGGERAAPRGDAPGTSVPGVDERSVQQAPPAPERAAPATESVTAADQAAPAAEGPSSASRATLQQAPDEAVEPDCQALRSGEPRPWLACIRARLDNGAVAGARAELAQFVLAHPDYPLPGDLAERLTE